MCDGCIMSKSYGGLSSNKSPNGSNSPLSITCIKSCGPMYRYLCKLPDKELRGNGARHMADMMWSTIKEPVESPLCFDQDSLELAFKFFTSATLTMRLTGLGQITVSQLLLTLCKFMYIYIDHGLKAIMVITLMFSNNIHLSELHGSKYYQEYSLCRVQKLSYSYSENIYAFEVII